MPRMALFFCEFEKKNKVKKGGNVLAIPTNKKTNE